MLSISNIQEDLENKEGPDLQGRDIFDRLKAGEAIRLTDPEYWGGIIIENDVLTGPKVNLITENHPLEPANRRALTCKPIIKRNVWIGATATIFPGVTTGENTVVAAGTIVSKDVPANTVGGGIPASE